ncbi:PREDICTED: protein FAM122A [Papilio xuthus]|uniref:Protein FAM122A n=1 Tax=Papilio xuthus TaxID=66420 RepID=A0AAJ7EIL4_PAPXU|nr:PREDICTED: protein FAM122A [Papilio xuthus]
MDVDAPNILKRSSSAPLINEAASTAVTSPTTNTAPRSTSFFSMFSNNNLSRTRRHSGSSSPITAPNNLSSVWGRRMTPRVSQLRAEECADVSNTREVAHEREVHCAMQMGQSCEDLALAAGAGAAHSPTRLARFSPVVSPSPTRKYTTRRSLSPIAIRAATLSPVSRPSALGGAGGGKRRWDEGDSPLPKRMCTDRLTPSTPGTPDSDLECTFRPVSPRHQPMHEAQDPDAHKATPS